MMGERTTESEQQNVALARTLVANLDDMAEKRYRIRCLEREVQDAEQSMFWALVEHRPDLLKIDKARLRRFIIDCTDQPDYVIPSGKTEDA